MCHHTVFSLITTPPVSSFCFCSVASKTKFFENASRQVGRYVKCVFLQLVFTFNVRYVTPQQVDDNNTTTGQDRDHYVYRSSETGY